MGWKPTGSGGGGGLPAATTKGDIAVYDGSAWQILAAGTDTHVLTADAAQSLGLKWAAGGGGGGSTVPAWMERLAAPLSPHADDQEFTGSIAGTAVAPTGTVTWTQDNGVLSAAFEDQSSGDHCPRLWPLTPGSAPVTLETRFRRLTLQGPNSMSGICVTDGTTTAANATAIGTYEAGPVLARWSGTLTNMTTANIATNLNDGADATWVYMRLIWTATNTFAFAMSPDGVSWTDFSTASWAATLAPTHFGVWVSSWSQTFVSVSSFEYLRVVESDLSV